MDSVKKHHLYLPYIFTLCILLIFIVFAFVLDSPGNIARGMWTITTSRAILISDYIEIGGIGATLVNAALSGAFCVLLMVRSAVKPNGAIIMALWLAVGFSFFGKNLYNIIPLMAGVWLYSWFRREPFINYSLAAVLSSTLAPIISELSFMGTFPIPVGMLLGVVMGMAAGFLMPAISSYSTRIHNGYLLYNGGFAGGLIATFFSSALRSMGLEFHSVRHWSTGNNLPLALFLYSVSLAMIVGGYLLGGKKESREKLSAMMKHPGRLVTDFYLLYGNSVFLNMGLLCAFGTTLVLAMGGELNGPTMGGILTVMGFGCFGKHLRNITPVAAGAVLSTYANMWDPISPVNSLAILFSTGLAPIAGHYGWFWGVVAGFLHVNIANYIGQINSGLNLYNNGFAGGFVAMFLIPLIEGLRRGDKDES